jgi:hypothetical protein
MLTMSEQDEVISSNWFYVLISTFVCSGAKAFHGYVVQGADYIPKSGTCPNFWALDESLFLAFFSSAWNQVYC